MNPAAHRSARTYASVDVQSRADGSGPHEVVLMLFEGLLERIQLGKRALQERDIVNKVRHIDRAIQILSEGLRTHLDLKAGGELAQQLDTLYGYCLVRLLDANAHNEASALDEVHSLLTPVADAWRTSRAAKARTPLPTSTRSDSSPNTVPYPAARGAFASPSHGAASTALRIAA